MRWLPKEKLYILILLLIPSFDFLFADGVILSTIKEKDTKIHSQECLIVHNKNKETVIIRTFFEGKDSSYTWLFPLPSYPLKIEKTDDFIFSYLRYLTRPFIISSSSSLIFFILSGLIVIFMLYLFNLIENIKEHKELSKGLRYVFTVFTLLIIFLYFVISEQITFSLFLSLVIFLLIVYFSILSDVRANILALTLLMFAVSIALTSIFSPLKAILVITVLIMIIYTVALLKFWIVYRIICWVLLVLLLVVPNYISMSGGAGKFLYKSSNVKILEFKKLKPYNIFVISATDHDSLIKWLEDRKFYVSAIGKEIIDYYVKKGWYFALIKLKTASQNPKVKNTYPSLKFVFYTDSIIFPFKLTSLHKGKVKVLVYSITPFPVELKNFKVLHKDTLRKSNIKNFNNYFALNLEKTKKWFITKFYGEVEVEKMKKDLILEKDDEEGFVKSSVYTSQAKTYIIFSILLICSFLLFLIFIKRGNKKFRYLFIFILFFILMIITSQIVFNFYPYEYEEVEAPHFTYAKANAYYLFDLLEKFRDKYGYYPASITLSFKDILKEINIQSLNDTSFFGTHKEPIILKNIGSEGPSLMKSKVLNPVFPFDSNAPLFATSYSDTPLYLIPGLVWYVPLKVRKNIAEGYKIYVIDEKENILQVIDKKVNISEIKK